MKFLAILLLSLVSVFGETDPALIREVKSADNLLDIGDAICLLSVRGLFPGVYDIGILTMMAGKSKMEKTYQSKFHEAPPQFGESGESAYKWGWLFKGSAVATLYLGAQTDNLGVGVVGFVILYLTGVAKHWEASRLIYDQGSNAKNLIMDEDQPVSLKPSDGLGLTYSFSF